MPEVARSQHAVVSVWGYGEAGLLAFTHTHTHTHTH